MSEPTRLMESTDTSLESDLLRAAAHEAPPPEARQKVLAALGLTAAASAVATSGSAGAGAIGTNATSTVAVMSKLAVAKVSLAVALVGAAGGGAYALRRAEPVAPRTVPAASIASVAASASIITAPEASAPGPEQSPPEQIVTPPPVAKVQKSAPPVIKKSLSDEVALIDRARASLASKQYAAALDDLDTHAHDFPAGALRPEATALRVEVLARSGDHARARALGESFLVTHPQGAASRRVRAILDGLQTKP